MTGRLQRAAAVVAVVSALPLAACSSSSGSSSPASPGGATATRWWSNSAVAAGSTIDAGDPTSAVGRLHPSRTDYCGMLRQTLAAGRSILPGVAATDPALLASTKAFVGELTKVAPAEVSTAWQTFGRAVLTVVESGGDASKVAGQNTAAVQKATATIAADARTQCHVDLSKTAK